jgi:hypothetical protein
MLFAAPLASYIPRATPPALFVLGRRAIPEEGA